MDYDDNDDNNDMIRIEGIDIITLNNENIEEHIIKVKGVEYDKTKPINTLRIENTGFITIHIDKTLIITNIYVKSNKKLKNITFDIDSQVKIIRIIDNPVISKIEYPTSVEEIEFRENNPEMVLSIRGLTQLKKINIDKWLLYPITVSYDSSEDRSEIKDYSIEISIVKHGKERNNWEDQPHEILLSHKDLLYIFYTYYDEKLREIRQVGKATGIYEMLEINMINDLIPDIGTQYNYVKKRDEFMKDFRRENIDIQILIKQLLDNRNKKNNRRNSEIKKEEDLYIWFEYIIRKIKKRKSHPSTHSSTHSSKHQSTHPSTHSHLNKRRKIGGGKTRRNRRRYKK